MGEQSFSFLGGMNRTARQETERLKEKGKTLQHVEVNKLVSNHILVQVIKTLKNAALCCWTKGCAPNRKT